MNQQPIGPTLEMQLVRLREVATAYIPAPETIALGRAHGRALAGSLAMPPTDGLTHASNIGVTHCWPGPGSRLTPARIALLAAHGVSQVSVYRRPTVALLF